MKKFFLLALIITLRLNGFSQTSLSLSKLPFVYSKCVSFNKGNEDCSPSNNAAPNGTFLNFNSPSVVNRSGEIVIGNTTYDNLPSNQRLFPGANGKLSATWTGSTWIGVYTGASSNWPDRGTFTNFFDGTNWGPLPTVRIESIRSGFPSNVILGNGTEWNCSHVPVDTLLDLMSRPVAGTGSWTETLPSSLEVMWPHATAWGNYIHVIGSHNKKPTNNYLQYSRSSNGGLSWDIQNVTLPEIDSVHCIKVMSADNYGIDARNHTVAIIGGGFNNSTCLWKSSDDGANWVKTTIWNFPLCGMDGNQTTDLNSDGIIDTLETSDGSFAILIDNNNIVHCWFGYTKVRDTNPNDTGKYNYYPGMNALLYWNETLPTDSLMVIGSCPDIDGDGTLNGLGADYPKYNVSLASMPTVAMDTANNIIYCVFTAPIENTDLFGDPNNASAQSFRDLFGTYSTDNGLTWSNQANLTNTATTFVENVYPSASKYTRNSNVDVMWMRDDDPGTSLTSQVTPDPVHLNDIVFNSFTMTNFNGIKNIEKSEQSFVVFPNPSNGFINLNFSGMNSTTGNISIVNLLGQTVKSLNHENLSKVIKIDATDLVNGTYFITVQTNDQVITQKVNITK